MAIGKAEKKKTNQRAVLQFISGPHPDEFIKLRRDATIFGREKGDIIITDKEISSTHCQIQEIEGVYHIFDMNSTNGTFVNKDRILKAALKDGDTVTIGTTTFRFEVREEKAVRHISTVFKSKSEKNSTTSIVDTLIESELASSHSNSMRLEVTYSNGQSETIVLKQKIIFIGRASSFGQFDQDTEISRKHLLIKLNDNGDIFIEDQQSTNGTFLNDKRIHGMHLVSSQDLVRVGGVTLKISPEMST